MERALAAVDWFGVTWAAVLAIATGVLALGIIVAIYQLRDARSGRHAEMATTLSLRWDGERLVAVRTLLRDFRSPEQLCAAVRAARQLRDPLYYQFIEELNFFEDLATAEKFGWVHLDWINETMGSVVKDRWERWSHTVDYLRQPTTERPKDPTIYANFQELDAKLRYRLPSFRSRIGDFVHDCFSSSYYFRPPPTG